MLFAIGSIAITVELYKKKWIEKASERLIYLFSLCVLSVILGVEKLWTFAAVGTTLAMEQFAKPSPMSNWEKEAFFVGGIAFLACRFVLDF